MSPRIPWMDEALGSAEREAASALANAQVAPEPWSASKRQAVLEAVRARADRGHFGLLRPFALVATAAMAAALIVLVVHRPSTLPVPAVAEVEASGSGEYTFTPALGTESAKLRVVRGTAVGHAHRGVPVQLEAPGMLGQIDAETFRVQVAGAVTRLEVEGGSATLIGRGGRVVYLHSGEAVGSDDPRLRAPVPDAAPAAAPAIEARPDRCVGLAPLARHDCYVRVALGDDLAAQNALFELGLEAHDRLHDGAGALDYWRSYQKRFPAGALGPEASVAILGELMAEGDLASARREAEHFLAAYPQDGRVGQVELAHAELACRAGLASGLDELEKLGPGSGLDRGELLFRAGGCAEHLGRLETARSDWREYLEVAPEGGHAAEIRRLLGE